MVVIISDHAVLRLNQRGYLPHNTPAEADAVFAELRHVAQSGIVIASNGSRRRPRPRLRVGMVGGRLTVVRLQHDQGLRVDTVYPANRRVRAAVMRYIFLGTGRTPPLAA